MRDLSLAIPTSYAKKKTSVSAYKLNLAILSAIAILGITYLFVINSLGTKGYEIKKLDQQATLMEDQQKALMMQVSDLQSINKIQDQAQKLNFVPTNNVTYLKDSDFALR